MDMYPMRSRDDEQLDALFQAYREACTAPAASANFMPNLWAQIDARQRFTFSFSRMAGAFVTAALALSVALGVYLTVPANTGFYTQSYVEALSTQDNSPEFVEPVRFEVR